MYASDLKSVNLPTLNTSDYPGKDGLATGSNPTVGRDAFGMQLHYHNGDFAGGPTAFTGTRSEASFKGLYNGNIAGWSYTSRSENGTPQTTMLSTYSYDKLNRLKQDQPHTMVGNVSTTSSKWSSNYSYDLDGNITNLERKDGSGSGIDNLSYVYPASGGKTITNRLRHIVDYLTPNDNGKGVVDQDPDNYSYDATGNLIGDAKEGITSITWTPYNKIRELVKTNAAPATGTTTLRYLYDAAGNRVVKDYHATQNTTLTSRTWYIRNAQGTVLAIYTRKPTAGNSGSVTRTEAPIYGSSRIGQSTRTATYDATASGEATLLGTVYSRELGKRAYELVDHLGNVRATISDILVPRTATNTYDADILTLTDYYPFGMQMDTRTWEASGVAGHRYGYGGHERVDEASGTASIVDMGDRWLDVRTGRTPKTDAKEGNYSYISPYAYGLNNPISVVDYDGKDVYLVVWKSKQGHSGHAGIAVDNYKQIAVRVKENGRVITKTEWVKDGTVTYYDLWPAEQVNNEELQTDVQEDYNKRTFKESDLLAIDVSRSREVGHVSQNGEGGPADGVVRITSTYDSDQRVKARLDGILSSNKDYNACHFNCSTFAQEGLKVLYPKLDASQTIKPSLFMYGMGLRTAQAVAPNNLFNAAAELSGSTVLKGPQKMEAKPYLEYFGK